MRYHRIAEYGGGIGSVVERALYYPWINPPESWIKAQLLLFDEVSSIVPNQWDIEGAPLILWLQDQGAWTSTTLDSLDQNGNYIAEMESALLSLAELPQLHVEESAVFARNEFALLQYGKLSHLLTRSIEDLGLGRPEAGSGLVVRRRVGAIMMSIAARHIAEFDSNFDSEVRTSTDVGESFHHAYGPLRRGDETNTPRLEVLLKGVLPVPGEEVPIEDILDFRRRHSDELSRLRVEVQRLARDTCSPDASVGELRATRREIELAVADVASAARSRRLRLGIGTASIICLSVAMKSALPAEELHWIFDGFGTTASAALGAAIVRGEPRGNAYTYVARAQSEFAAPPARRRTRRWLRW